MLSIFLPMLRDSHTAPFDPQIPGQRYSSQIAGLVCCLGCLHSSNVKCNVTLAAGWTELSLTLKKPPLPYDRTVQ